MVDVGSGVDLRYGNLRPGLTLLAIEDAAIPATLVYADVLAQERKGLPLLNEFILRFCGTGMSSVSAIAEICGLEAELVEIAVSECISSGDIAYSVEPARIGLTAQGLRTQEVLEAVQPVDKRIPLVFDRLTWAVSDLSPRELLTRRDCEDLGYTLLPASRTAKIIQNDVPISEINDLLRRQRSGRSGRIEILKLRKIASNTHRYIPCKMLVFGSEDGTEAEVSLVVDQQVSSAHDLAVAGLGGARALGVAVVGAEPRPVLDKELEAKRLEAASADPPPAPASVISEVVRGISVLEHREHLENALTQARRRLLLISPWVRAAVVNQTFVRQLESRLRAGCTVTIAYGIGKDDDGSDAKALDALAKLASRHSGFTFARLQNTHAKVLVYDDTWISTSFNWLSFRGDPSRTYRMEEGTLVTVRSKVTEEYARYLEMIDNQRIRV